MGLRPAGVRKHLCHRALPFGSSSWDFSGHVPQPPSVFGLGPRSVTRITTTRPRLVAGSTPQQPMAANDTASGMLAIIRDLFTINIRDLLKVNPNIWSLNHASRGHLPSQLPMPAA